MKPAVATTINPFASSTGPFPCETESDKPAFLTRLLRQLQARASSFGKNAAALASSVTRVMDLRILSVFTLLCLALGCFVWEQVQERKGFRSVRRLDRTLVLHSHTNRMERLTGRVELAWEQKERLSIPERSDPLRGLMVAKISPPSKARRGEGVGLRKARSSAGPSARPKPVAIASKSKRSTGGRVITPAKPAVRMTVAAQSAKNSRDRRRT